jgi:hypothetical protein
LNPLGIPLSGISRNVLNPSTNRRDTQLPDHVAGGASSSSGLKILKRIELEQRLRRSLEHRSVSRYRQR